MPSLRAQPTRRSFLAQATTLALAAVTLPNLAACHPAKSPPIALLTDAPNPTDSPLAFLATVQNLEADLLRHALNKTAAKSPNAHLSNPNDYALHLAAGSLSPAESAAGFHALVTFAFAAHAHKNFLTNLLQANNLTPPRPGKYQLNVARPNLASLLDALYPLAEITQRSYLAVISQLSDLRQIQQLAAIHSVKSAQLATFAMVLSADPLPRRFETDEQCARTQFAENDLEYFRDPKLLLEALNQYTVA
jgi:hypothetical protein